MAAAAQGGVAAGSAPAITATPVSPSATPSRRAGVACSAPARCATSTPNSGVVALKTEATPEGSVPCAQTIRLKGIALLSRPMPRCARHAAPSRRIGNPCTAATSQRMAAPRPTRASTMDSGGHSRAAMPTKKKLPAQTVASASSSAQAREVRDIGR